MNIFVFVTCTVKQLYLPQIVKYTTVYTRRHVFETVFTVEIPLHCSHSQLNLVIKFDNLIVLNYQGLKNIRRPSFKQALKFQNIGPLSTTA